MKNIAKILIIIVIISFFTLDIAAEEPDDYIKDFEEILPEEYGDILSEGLESRVGPEALLYEIERILAGRGSLIFGFFSSLLGTLLFMSVAGLCPERLREGAVRGVSVISSVYIGSMILSLFAETRDALISASGFFSSAIPIMTLVTLSGGGAKSAAVGAAGMNTVLSIVGGLFTASLSALVGFSLAMGLSSAVGGDGSRAVLRSAKNLFFWLFGIGSALLMGTLSLQSFVSGASDSAAMRTAKYMAQSSIPLVGGAVSASLSTLASGLMYAKGVIGAGAVFVLLMLLLSPLIMLLFYRLSLSCALSLSELIGVKEAAGAFNSFRGAIDITIALYALSGILYIFEIILFIKSGVALL